MHRRTIALESGSQSLAAVTAFMLTLPAPGSAATRIAPEDTLERAVVVELNAIRRARGLPKLASATRLETAGAKHVTNMAVHGYFRHSWSTGASFGTWIRWFWPGPGYTSWTAGENLYWTAPGTTAKQVVGAWMKSPGHRANILRAGWRKIGVGAVSALGPSGAYRRAARATIVAAEFGRRS